MTINEFIQEHEGRIVGQWAKQFYEMLCLGFVNDLTYESFVADYLGCRGHLIFEGEELTDVTIHIEDLALGEDYTFRFKMENISDDGPSRYRELN